MSSPPSFPQNHCAQTCVFVFVDPARYLCRRKGLCAFQFSRFHGILSKALRGYGQVKPSIRPINSHSPFTSFRCREYHMFCRLQPTEVPSFTILCRQYSKPAFSTFLSQERTPPFTSSTTCSGPQPLHSLKWRQALNSYYQFYYIQVCPAPIQIFLFVLPCTSCSMAGWYMVYSSH